MRSSNYSTITLLVIVACISTFPSCENSLNGEFAPRQTTNIKMATNGELDGLAQAINFALLRSADFNDIIKNKALEKFDGDYDVMLQTLGEQELSDYNSTRAGNGNRCHASKRDVSQ